MGLVLIYLGLLLNDLVPLGEHLGDGPRRALERVQRVPIRGRFIAVAILLCLWGMAGDYSWSLIVGGGSCRSLALNDSLVLLFKGTEHLIRLVVLESASLLVSSCNCLGVVLSIHGLWSSLKVRGESVSG